MDSPHPAPSNVTTLPSDPHADPHGESHADSPKKASIREVAKLAGVSTSSVSLVMNGRGRIGDETRARVERAAADLNYRPNPSAQNMRGKRSGIVGIIERTPEETSWRWDDLEFVVRLTNALCSAAWDQGWYPTLLPGDVGADKLAELPLDGVILIDPLAADPLLAELQRLQIPVVTMGRDSEADASTGSWADNDKPAQCEAVATLLRERGATHILMVSALSGQSYMTDNVETFMRLGTTGDVRHSVVEVPVSSTSTHAYDVVAQALTGDHPVDAVYVVVESLVRPILDAIADAGLAIPRDVQVLTSTDSAMARSGRTPLTTFDLKPAELGTALVQILHERLAGADDGIQRFVPADLVMRGSTR